MRVHPYVAEFLEQVARVGLAGRREKSIEDEARDLLQEGQKLADAGKAKQAAAKLRKAQRLLRAKR